MITIIDADRMLGLSDDYMELALSQLMTGDIILLNKIDIAKPNSVAQISHTINTLIPNARMIETSHCDVPMEILFDVAHAGKKLNTHHHHVSFDTWSWESEYPLSLDALQTLVGNLPTTIYRAKGILYVAGNEQKQGVFQLVGKRANLSFKEIWGVKIPKNLILINGTDLDKNSLNIRFEGCLMLS